MHLHHHNLYCQTRIQWAVDIDQRDTRISKIISICISVLNISGLIVSAESSQSPPRGIPDPSQPPLSMVHSTYPSPSSSVSLAGNAFPQVLDDHHKVLEHWEILWHRNHHNQSCQGPSLRAVHNTSAGVRGAKSVAIQIVIPNLSGEFVTIEVITVFAAGYSAIMSHPLTTMVHSTKPSPSSSVSSDEILGEHVLSSPSQSSGALGNIVASESSQSEPNKNIIFGGSQMMVSKSGEP